MTNHQIEMYNLLQNLILAKNTPMTNINILSYLLITIQPLHKKALPRDKHLKKSIKMEKNS